MSDPTPLGQRLKLARLMTFPREPEAGLEPEAGWQRLSQRELSLMADRSEGLVGHLERGCTKDTTGRTARELCRVLGISLDWLMTGDGPAHVGGGKLDAETVNRAVHAARAATEAA